MARCAGLSVEERRRAGQAQNTTVPRALEKERARCARDLLGGAATVLSFSRRELVVQHRV